MRTKSLKVVSPAKQVWVHQTTGAIFTGKELAKLLGRYESTIRTSDIGNRIDVGYRSCRRAA